MKKIFALLIVFQIIFSKDFFAQRPGDLDSTFGVNGIVVTDFEEYDIRINQYNPDGIKAIFPLADGKILCAGTADNGKHFIFSKYNSNGDKDLEFGSEGVLKIENIGMLTCGGKNHQSKVIVAGYNDSEIVLTKINELGELDEEFGEGGVVKISWDISGYSVKIRAMDFQDDDKIILVGDLTNDTFSNVGGVLLYRLLENGVIDSTFGENGRVIYNVLLSPFAFDPELLLYSVGELNSVKVLPDNKILAGGHLGYQSTLIRFHSNGSLDETFGIDGAARFSFFMSGSTGGGTGSIFKSFIIDKFGKIFPTGYCFSPILMYTNIVIGCVNYAGIMEDSFGEGGLLLYDDVNYNHSMSILVQDNNKIITSGYRYYSSSGYKYCFQIIRFHENGTIDSTFGENGIVRTHISDSSLAFCSALQEDGKLLVAGVSDSGAFTIARYHTQSAPTSVLPIENTNNKLLLYPNPVSDVLFIDDINELILQIEIKDVLGREMHLPVNDKSINVSSLPSGLYFIKIKTEKGELFGKFVKE